jgi:hypothetical protein
LQLRHNKNASGLGSAQTALLTKETIICIITKRRINLIMAGVPIAFSEVLNVSQIYLHDILLCVFWGKIFVWQEKTALGQ